jgi:hypothetical protein
MTGVWSESADEEARRQQAVDRTGIVRLPLQAELQQIVESAAKMANSSFAVITIIDNDRQWFAARVGDIVVETPRFQSFCNHAILRPG